MRMSSEIFVAAVIAACLIGFGECKSGVRSSGGRSSGGSNTLGGVGGGGGGGGYSYGGTLSTGTAGIITGAVLGGATLFITICVCIMYMRKKKNGSSSTSTGYVRNQPTGVATIANARMFQNGCRYDGNEQPPPYSTVQTNMGVHSSAHTYIPTPQGNTASGYPYQSVSMATPNQHIVSSSRKQQQQQQQQHPRAGVHESHQNSKPGKYAPKWEKPKNTRKYEM